MSQFESGKPVKTLLAEYVDGGPKCIRDDCDVRVHSFERTLLSSDIPMLEENVKRCVSCGKTWKE